MYDDWLNMQPINFINHFHMFKHPYLGLNLMLSYFNHHQAFPTLSLVECGQILDGKPLRGLIVQLTLLFFGRSINLEVLCLDIIELQDRTSLIKLKTLPVH